MGDFHKQSITKMKPQPTQSSGSPATVNSHNPYCRFKNTAGSSNSVKSTGPVIAICNAIIRTLILAAITLIAGPAHAGVNLIPNTAPGYSKPLSLYVNGSSKIVAAWCDRNSGNSYAAAHQVGFYVNNQRVLVATINGLSSGYSAYGTDAPLDAYLPNGTSTVELRVNDSRWIAEDSYSDNIYTLTVNVSRGGSAGGGGGTTPTPLTRAEASYKWSPSFGSSTTSRIISRMTDMLAVQWKPTADFSNWGYTDTRNGNEVFTPYAKGTTYYGLPYCQSEPTNASGFTGYLPRMSGKLSKAASAGVDCSRAVAIAYEMTSNYNTTAFDTGTSSYFTTVVAKGSLAKSADKIQIGDAIVAAGWHMMLVAASPVNGRVDLLESTSDQGTNINGLPQRMAVVRNNRSLADLDAKKCRVIRRNKLQ